MHLHEPDSSEALQAILAAGRDLQADPSEVAQLCADLATSRWTREALQRKERASYRRPEVCLGLVDWSFSLHHQSPRRMLELSRLARTVSDALDDGSGLREILTDVRAQARLALGNALRVNGRFQAAAAVLRKAEELLLVGTGNPLLGARLLHFQAKVLTEVDRQSEAVELLKQARRCFDGLGQVQDAMAVQVSAGISLARAGQLDEALSYYYSALGNVDAGRDPELTLGIVYNIASVLNRAGFPEEAAEVARDSYGLYRFQPSRKALLGFQWCEARICAKLGYRNEAIAVLSAVRSAFLAQRLPFDAALAGLDLATLFALQGRSFVTAALGSESLLVCQSRGLYRGAKLSDVLWARLGAFAAL